MNFPGVSSVGKIMTNVGFKWVKYIPDVMMDYVTWEKLQMGYLNQNKTSKSTFIQIITNNVMIVEISLLKS